MFFKDRVRIAEKYKEWLNEKPIVLDSPQAMLAFLDVNGYLNKVVRCKDCMFNHWHETPNGEKYHICNLNQLAFSEHDNFYCAYGERRDDERKH